jgi:hypothetical protein
MEMMRGLGWAFCRPYERLLPLVRDDAALERRGVGIDEGFSMDAEGRCACGLGMAQAVRAAGLCGSCGQRRLEVGTAPAGDARRDTGDDGRFGLACAVRTSASSRSCATMRPSVGRGVASDGPLISVDVEGRCACGLGMVQAVRAAGLCGCCGQRRLGFGTAPASDARREAGDDGRFGFAFCSSYERLLPLVCDDAALGRRGVGSDGGFRVDGEGRCACGLGMVLAVWAAGLCGSCGPRRLGLGKAPAGDARRQEGVMRGLFFLRTDSRIRALEARKELVFCCVCNVNVGFDFLVC